MRTSWTGSVGMLGVTLGAVYCACASPEAFPGHWGTGWCATSDDCDDGNACTDDECLLQGVCSHIPVPTSSPCGVDGQLHCNKDAQCVGCQSSPNLCGKDTECRTWLCEDDTCKFSDAPAGTPLLEQEPQDCKETRCDGKGGFRDEPSDDPPKDDGDPCTIQACDGLTIIDGELAPVGTLCGASADCSMTANQTYEQTSAAQCNEDGSCSLPITSSCGTYVCDPETNSCKINCVEHDDCVGGHYCSGGTCTKKGNKGATCKDPESCTSGYCVDGVCCDDVCGNPCQRCDGPTPGTCTNIAKGEDPHDECPGARLCDGFGACALPDGAECSEATECLSGFCQDGVCCDGACSASCHACDNAGSVGQCSLVPTGTDPHNDCSVMVNGTPNAAAVCNTNGSCKLLDGEACTQHSDCMNNHCVNYSSGVGVCCNKDCDGPCRSCRESNTGQADGTCANVNNGTWCGAGKSCKDGACQ